jgi:AraC-like DNA-binding protein
MHSRDYPITYAAILLDEVRQLGASRHELLQRTGLDPTTLNNPESRISDQQFKTMFIAATELTGEPAIALRFGQHLTLTSHGVFGYAVMSCRNIRQVIEILTKYYRLLLNEASLNVSIEGDDVAIEYRPARHQMIDRIRDSEVFFSGVVSSIKHLLHLHHLDARLELSHQPPEYSDSYSQILGIPVSFGASSNRIVLPLELMEEKPEYANPVMLKLYQQQCDELLSRMDNSGGLHSRVREYLVGAKQQFPSLEQSANHFHMSPRTFRRRLREEQVSFQKILDEVRQELAETYLRNPAISVNNTADLLGFHDVSNFRRAFIRWSGQSPSAYKKASSGGAHARM